MSTLNEREAALRRALYAAASGVDPSDDGLERIRARLGRPRPVVLAWAEAALTDVRLRTPLLLELWLEKLRLAGREVTATFKLWWRRFGPTPKYRAGSPASRALSWLRPIATLGVFVTIVAAGAYGAMEAQTALTTAGSNSQRSTGPGGVPAGPPNGTAGPNSRSHSSLGTGPYISPSPTCRPRPSNSASSSPPGGIISSPSTTPSGTPSPTPSGTPSSGAAGTTSNSTAPAAQTSAPSAKSGKGSRPRHPRLPWCTTGSHTQRISVPHGQNGAAVPSPTPTPNASASGTSAPLVVSAARLNDGS